MRMKKDKREQRKEEEEEPSHYKGNHFQSFEPEAHQVH
jgi:hypothetical protein